MYSISPPPASVTGAVEAALPPLLLLWQAPIGGPRFGAVPALLYFCRDSSGLLPFSVVFMFAVRGIWKEGEVLWHGRSRGGG